MTKLNLIECSILEASGELGAASSRRLHRYFARHPYAQREFDEIKRQLDLVRSIPHTELSAAERKAIPAAIKKAIAERLRERARAERAQHHWKLLSYLFTGAATAVAAALVITSTVLLEKSATRRTERERIAQIDTATDRLAPYDDTPNQYDREITNVQASIDQLRTEDPTTVAGVNNREMISVFNALIAVPNSDPDMDVP